jgi:hypothetical protein
MTKEYDTQFIKFIYSEGRLLMIYKIGNSSWDHRRFLLLPDEVEVLRKLLGETND